MSAICKEYCSWRSFDDMLELVTKSGASKTSSANLHMVVDRN